MCRAGRGDGAADVSTYVVVTGTDTGVGKTVATAAFAAHHLVAGASVVVVKPVQTGLRPAETEAGDAAVVARLSGCGDVHELVRLGDPLAPDTAARRAGRVLPTVLELAELVAERATGADVVLVEGAGGVRVRLDHADGTVLDLARCLQWHGDVRVVVVVRAGLGTLNHTELTVDAIRRAGLDVDGLVIGSWPSKPGLAERCNIDDLPRVTGYRLLAALPAGCGSWTPERFRAGVPHWLSTLL